MTGKMKVNTPREIPMCYYVRCIDDSPSKINKPVTDVLVKGQIYTAYSLAKSLNSEDLSYYIKDASGRKIEAHEGVPTWRAERFEVLFEQYLN